MSWHPEPETLYETWMEAQAVAVCSCTPCDRPDPSEYEDRLYLSKRLDCGHLVEASEDSGGMDELDRVALADVQRLLDFKVASHNCGPF